MQGSGMSDRGYPGISRGRIENNFRNLIRALLPAAMPLKYDRSDNCYSSAPLFRLNRYMKRATLPNTAEEMKGAIDVLLAVYVATLDEASTVTEVTDNSCKVNTAYAIERRMFFFKVITTSCNIACVEHYSKIV